MSDDHTDPRPDHASSEPPAPRSRADRRERAVCDALRALLRDHYHHHFRQDVRNGKPVDLSLRITTDPARAWDVSFDPPFSEQIHDQLEDVEANSNVFESGRIYCFRCESSACDHSHPPSPRAVFRGYTSTGIPDWCELAQTLIETRDERVDRLYQVRPAVLARVQLGRELKQEQLSVFGKGSKTYGILGQVVAGYFTAKPSRVASLSAPLSFAITVQAVETRTGKGGLSLRLNVIPGAFSTEDWEDLLASPWRPSLYRAIHTAARTLADLETQVRARRDAGDPAGSRKALGRLPRILNELARMIESGSRSDSRRTQHAQDRRRDQRPVHKAVEDTQRARDDAFFYDLKRKTVVVLGSQGRAHVFNDAGMHVTSFTIKPDGAEFRVRTNRWRAASDVEIHALRAQLGQTAVP